MINFGRVITAMITPFDENGAVNYSVVEKLAANLAENGSDSIVVCGTTGESPTLTWSEEYQLFKVVKAAVSGKAKVIAGTGSNSSDEAIEATKQAAKLDVDGSLQVVPYYNKPPQSGLYCHYEAIAKSCPDLPILLYNVPSRTSQNLLPETVAKLAKIPNIVGIKEASGNIDQASQIRATTPKEFTIYSGDDSLTLPLLAVGATGVVSIASHLVGNQIQEMIQAFESGKNQLATQIHVELFPLFKVLFCTTNPIPLKAALKMQGWQVGSPRLPLTELPEELLENLELIMKQSSLIK
ncbi:4-hydroxy-tetrahydrodipicolinate synthase [Merismopedia glauca CCAP 1448/3]|uniref:4-hydroxy-tetrahydrodipicolinate synthase n=1 Tax=Merismopedia glauca CCAP 1448/3 TaxID=1296344 RepID=A0A2T1BXD0_9CYAN|nr:4-hydroxy-tetrahydrodipicolinate synthase [Merismopedia glauca]PSB00651.1 4-hydroxy-tetrahydrodipicolinate synthase [Merismopedia glauca CCAP 1448/3]